MSLSVSNLSCQRGGRPIFAGLNFEIADGQAMVLRGPNGAGKSTLLRVLSGLIPAQSGDVSLNGVSLAKREEFQDQITYAGHLDAIKPQLTVAENLRFWADLFNSAAFDQTLQNFRLTEIAERQAHTCSAGQKRRLGLARIAVTARPMWLLDEPTVSLDTETTEQFARLIDSHCASGGMALIATHIDLGLANSAELRIETMTSEVRKSIPESDPFLKGDWT